MSKVKSFRFSDQDAQRIEIIERECGLRFGVLLKAFLDDCFFHVKGIETRTACYYAVDYDSELYGDFRTNIVQAYLDLKDMSIDAVVETCYGPDVQILQ